jgi:hypothetical protein
MDHTLFESKLAEVIARKTKEVESFLAQKKEVKECKAAAVEVEAAAAAAVGAAVGAGTGEQVVESVTKPKRTRAKKTVST